MNVFNHDSLWITEDNRRLRAVSPTTPESMNHKHAAMLPPGTLDGKTVLDLGCCIGGTGYWALRHGAAHYTGVEVQDEYVRIARALFESEDLSAGVTIHHSDITAWLEGQTRGRAPASAAALHDVVVIAGVLYGYIDPLYVLRMASELARECVVIDNAYPRTMRDPQASYMDIIPEQRMVVATHDHEIGIGAGSRLSPVAQDVIMGNYGFYAQRMAVAPITDGHDSYNAAYRNLAGGFFPMRYVTRYTRALTAMKSVNEAIASGEVLLGPQAVPPQ
ncbi:class I SAM-dependent methyltransferase [Ramlibacter humi]|nr:class I SAM-dependent methyltransferase [Ramlibacter humi]